MQNIEKVIQETDRAELFGLVLNDLFENVCEDGEPFSSYSERMTVGERMVILIWCFSCEAANGGVSQFLTNDSGNDFNETLEHLIRLGADQQAKAFNRVAKEIFDGNVPVDREARCAVYWNFSGENEDDPDWQEKEDQCELLFEEIDKYFGWCEDIKELATQYITSHAEEFDDSNRSKL